MKHTKWLTGAGLLVAVFVVLGVTQPWSDKPTPEITANTETVANNYLISKVGYDNFKKLYTFDRARGGYGDPKTSTYDFIAYHFTPFKTFANPEDVVMIQVNRHKPTEVYADVVPDCKKDKSRCDFNIDKQKALQIGNDNGITADDVTAGSTTMKDKYAEKKGLAFVIVVQSCRQINQLLSTTAMVLFLGVRPTARKLNCSVGVRVSEKVRIGVCDAYCGCACF